MIGNLFGNKKQGQEEVTDVSQVAGVVNTTQDEPQKKGFIGGLKDKAVEKMMERQLKALPAQQREVLMQAVKSNPDFFEMIAKKIKQEEQSNGGNQMAAAMKVMREHQGEMAKIMMNSK